MQTRKRVVLYSLLVALSYATCVVTSSKLMVAVMGLAGLLWAIRLGALLQRQWPGTTLPPEEQ